MILVGRVVPKYSTCKYSTCKYSDLLYLDLDSSTLEKIQMYLDLDSSTTQKYLVLASTTSSTLFHSYISLQMIRNFTSLLDNFPDILSLEYLHKSALFSHLHNNWKRPFSYVMSHLKWSTNDTSCSFKTRQ